MSESRAICYNKDWHEITTCADCPCHNSDTEECNISNRFIDISDSFEGIDCDCGLPLSYKVIPHTVNEEPEATEYDTGLKRQFLVMVNHIESNTQAHRIATWVNGRWNYSESTGENTDDWQVMYWWELPYVDEVCYEQK